MLKNKNNFVIYYLLFIMERSFYKWQVLESKWCHLLSNNERLDRQVVAFIKDQFYYHKINIEVEGVGEGERLHRTYWNRK